METTLRGKSVGITLQWLIAEASAQGTYDFASASKTSFAYRRVDLDKGHASSWTILGVKKGVWGPVIHFPRRCGLRNDIRSNGEAANILYYFQSPDQANKRLESAETMHLPHESPSHTAADVALALAREMSHGMWSKPGSLLVMCSTNQ